MVIHGPDSRNERLEVMLWQAGAGRQTSAVRRFIVRWRLTLAAALITQAGVTIDAIRNN